MTEQEMVNVVAESIPMDRANREQLARSFIVSAVHSVGRKNGVDFNQRTATATLTSGTKEYIVGVDIFTGLGAISSIANLHRTDILKWPIELVPKEEFYDKVSGYTTTGTPVMATLEAGAGEILTLVIYPIPDSAYPIKATVKVPVTDIQQIPSHYHDVIVAEANMMYAATKDAGIASVMLNRKEKSMEDDRLMSYQGKRLRVDFSLSSTLGRGRRASSRNITDN